MKNHSKYLFYVLVLAAGFVSAGHSCRETHQPEKESSIIVPEEQ